MAEGRVLQVGASRSFPPSKTHIQRKCYQKPVTSRGDVSDTWLCAYCHGLLILAFQTDCGCRFCKFCLDELAESNEERQCFGGAPICGPFAMNSGNFHQRPKPDKAVDRLIAKVIIFCPNKCGIQNLQAKRLFSHLEEDCPKQFCTQCGKLTERVDFERKHLKAIKCKDCSLDIAPCLFESHREDPMSKNFCPMFNGLCPYCKTEEIKANEMQHHRLFCEKWKQECKYEAIGCKGDHAKNTDEELVIHLTCILENVSKMAPQISSSAKNEARKKQSRENMRRCSETMKYLENIEQTIREDSEFTQRLDKAVEQVTNQRNVIEQYHQLFKRVTALSLHSQQPTPFPVAPYIWRIPNYLDLKKHESVLDSRPFVSDHYGYKMRVRLYLNGDGQGRGTHLSAYVILMSHDYDNLQPWPFQLPFLFTLLDQTQKGQDYQQLIHPNPKSRSFQRPPRTEAESVRASGCAKFFPLERLLPHCIYLLDGTLYIKIDILNRPGT